MRSDSFSAFLSLAVAIRHDLLPTNVEGSSKAPQLWLGHSMAEPANKLSSATRTATAGTRPEIDCVVVGKGLPDGFLEFTLLRDRSPSKLVDLP